MPLTATPWVVGFAPRLEVRRKRETPGALSRASSSRVAVASVSGPMRRIEKAASAGLGGRRAARTTTTSTPVGAPGG